MTIPGDVNLITALIQTGALGALIWLVIDTRREAREREARLLQIIDKQASRWEAVSSQLSVMSSILARLEVLLMKWES